MTEPVTALATTTARAPLRLITDPRDLDEAAVLDIIRRMSRRLFAITAIGTTAPAILAIGITGVVPLAAAATIPAMLVGYTLARRVTTRAIAAELGVTLDVLRAVEIAQNKVQLTDFVSPRKIGAREWLKPSPERVARDIVALLRGSDPDAPGNP